MKYPIAIESGNAKTAWGVVVPDLPGCFSAADSGIDEAIDNARESIELWIETALDSGQDIPLPRPTLFFFRRPITAKESLINIAVSTAAMIEVTSNMEDSQEVFQNLTLDIHLYEHLPFCKARF